MKWEWAVGEVILIVLCVYELWSLRKYDRKDVKAEPNPPKPPRN
jgi:hypothetical protein